MFLFSPSIRCSVHENISLGDGFIPRPLRPYTRWLTKGLRAHLSADIAARLGSTLSPRRMPISPWTRASATPRRSRTVAAARCCYTHIDGLLVLSPWHCSPPHSCCCQGTGSLALGLPRDAQEACTTSTARTASRWPYSLTSRPWSRSLAQ